MIAYHILGFITLVFGPCLTPSFFYPARENCERRLTDDYDDDSIVINVRFLISTKCHDDFMRFLTSILLSNMLAAKTFEIGVFIFLL